MNGNGYHVVLAPEPASASRARRFVGCVLERIGREDLTEPAQLCTSELVTNALVHGRSEVGLRISTTPSGVRVDVADSSPTGPLAKMYGVLAPTGRGLQVVADLASSVGVDHDGCSGKSVWFRLDDATDSSSATTNAWAPTHQEEDVGSEAVLVALPVRLWAVAQQHHDGMLRELLLHWLDRNSQGSFAPHTSLAEAETAQDLLAAAFDDARGDRSPPFVPDAVDVRVCFTPAQIPCFAALQDELDDAELLAAQGELLALPGLPEIVALRDWCCEQVLAQAAGVTPTRWPGAEMPGGGAIAHSRFHVSAPQWDDAKVRSSPEALVAADDHNRILAVSAAAAQLLGWEADDLVGRRVVTIIPPELRDAHVAGFTRHLTTGETRMLGRDVEVPALRAGGEELMCVLHLEREPAGEGRSVYVARLTPSAEPGRTHAGETA